MFNLDMNNITTILIMIGLVYIIGLMIVNLVDNKLSNVSIKIPSVKPNINLQVCKNSKDQVVIKCAGNEDVVSQTKVSKKSEPKQKFFTTKLTKTKIPIYNPNPYEASNAHLNPSSLETFLSVSFDDNFEPRKSSETFPIGKDVVVDPNFEETNFKTDMKKCDVETVVTPKIGCTQDSDCNIVHGNGQNICKVDGTCHCLAGSGLFCQYGPTNYKDPKDMTEEERERFKYKFRNNMTLQDYKNWLMLYKNDPEHLRQHHRLNLRKLLRGGVLTEKDVPAVTQHPPITAADYFTKLYKGGRISVHFPDNGSPYVGYNYTKYSDFIPPENEANNWVTGVVDIYKEGKDNARELNYYLRPDATVGLEEERIGERYQNELRKHHDLADLRKIIMKKDRPYHNFIDRDLTINKNDSLVNFESKDPNVKIN